MTDIQRINEAFDHLIDSGLEKYDKSIADSIDVTQDRIKYLRRIGAKALKSEEINSLKEIYTTINWIWVLLDEGSMLSSNEPSIKLVEEREIIYRKKPELDQLLSDIILGSSSLALNEQNTILRKELVRLQQKIIDLVKL